MPKSQRMLMQDSNLLEADMYLFDISVKGRFIPVYATDVRVYADGRGAIVYFNDETRAAILSAQGKGLKNG